MLVVAPSFEDAKVEARCSVYTGAHHGTETSGGVDDWERAKPKGRKGGKTAVKKKYPQAPGR